MRSAVTFDGHELSQSYLVAEVDRKPSGQTVATQTIVGRDGVVATGARANSTTVAMTIVARDPQQARRREVMRDLRAWLACSEPKPLAFADDEGLYYLAIPQGITETRFLNAIAWRVTFLIPQPYLLSPNKTVVVGSESFHYSGSAAARPIVTLANVTPASGVVGVTLDGQQVMQVPLAAAASTVVIDCGEDARTVLVDGSASMLTTGSDWWEITPGVHSAAVTTGTATMSVEWRERWVI
ncbi:distal tail protein Dit [uncultured Bifidobacterium sp.]|uniref:distal tail protein Dit n=1 Tax=uncultured Bifidobacterium sp. TaxID=165187 RepID=UPI0025FE98B9|nr:distal tail protein Dit [uncultured Bifidobacterium sp.]